MKITKSSWSRPIQLLHLIFIILVFCSACNNTQENLLATGVDQSFTDVGIDSQVDAYVAGESINEEVDASVGGETSEEYIAGVSISGSAGGGDP